MQVHHGSSLLRTLPKRSTLKRCGAAVVCLITGIMAASSTDALEFQLGGGWGSLDTSVSYGTAKRLSPRDQAIIGMENGGLAFSVNGDDGNLNYDAGDFISNTFKVTEELQLTWDRWRIFSRAYYFRDFQTMDWKSDFRTPLSNQAKNEIGEEVKLLDAYVAGDFRLGDMMLTLKGGNQVLNWGESTFIQNGINSMSPVDVSKLRVAGAELRDALEALPMIQASLGINDRFSVEGFVPFQWKNTEIEPSGSYFATNDFASPGGTRVLLGFGRPGISDTQLNTGVGAPVGVDVFRAADRDARDGGEFGVALRWFEPKLNDTEFGFYFTRLHSRLPLISGWTGLLEAGFAAGNYAGTANYFREFPEDIDTYGFSFNSEIPAFSVPLPLLGVVKTKGLAVQGEIAYKRNQPLQADDVELLFAALSPLDHYIGFDGPNEGFKQSQLAAGTPFGFDEYIAGYRRKDVVTAQVATTELLGPGLGADQWVFLTEVGAMWVKDMEDKSVLRYEGPGTYTSANPWFTAAGIQPGTETAGYADAFSWGYRAAMRAEFNNAFGSINLVPSLAWFHDVNGTSPSPVLNFVDGRQSLTTTLTANYLISWTAALSYTNYLGGGRYNLLNDRDFMSLTLGYSF